jgi:hypothetical protein
VRLSTAGPRTLPCREALSTSPADQALEAAHAGHRSPRPEAGQRQVAGREGQVLDFGLAKALESGSTTGLSDSPILTRAGVVLGTAAYMSFEQARGWEVDRRVDVWAFGCVLYAMLAGHRAFKNETGPVTLAAVLRGEPEWSSLPGEVPPSVRHLLRRCLQKDPERRPRDGAEVRREVERALEARRQSGRRRLKRFERFWARWVESPELGLFRFVQVSFRQAVYAFFAWFFDGRSLLYAAEVGNARKIFLRRLGSEEERPLTRGDHDDFQFVWLPDGSRIVFVRARQAGVRLEPGDVFGQHADGDFWSMDFGTGVEAKLAEGAFNPRSPGRDEDRRGRVGRDRAGCGSWTRRDATRSR